MTLAGVLHPLTMIRELLRVPDLDSGGWSRSDQGSETWKWTEYAPGLAPPDVKFKFDAASLDWRYAYLFGCHTSFAALVDVFL